jgi:hypothetical protein
VRQLLVKVGRMKLGPGMLFAEVKLAAVHLDLIGHGLAAGPAVLVIVAFAVHVTPAAVSVRLQV